MPWVGVVLGLRIGRYPRRVTPRSYRSLEVPVSGRLAHQRLLGRIGVLEHATIRRSSLRRLGSRKRRRLETPAYQSRIIVELVGVGPLGKRTALPYRGVSRDDIDGIVAEHGGHQTEIASASVRFSATADRRRECKRLLAQLHATVAGRQVVLDARVIEVEGDSLAPFTLPGLAHGAPDAVADIVDVLSASALVLPWDMVSHWHDAD